MDGGTQDHATNGHVRLSAENAARPCDAQLQESGQDRLGSKLDVDSIDGASGGISGISDMAVCASPADYAQFSRPRQTQRHSSPESPPSLGAALRKFAVDHQLGISINLILLASLTWLLFPSLRPRLQALSTICYRAPVSVAKAGDALYGMGPRDMGLVVTFMVVFTGLRAATLDYVLVPLATAAGISKRAGKIRFAEQFYLVIYYTFYWSWGVYLFARDTTPSLPISADGRRANLTVGTLLFSIWTQYPRLFLDSSMKLYYLSQLAFWIQQIIVVHVEKRRKDHYQMLSHHLVTVALLMTSYFYRQTRAGNAILVCMDLIDIIFPGAKVLKYLGWQTACDMAFALFVVCWLACRHVGYLAVLWSLHAHVNRGTMFYGTYSIEASDAVLASGDAFALGARISEDGGTAVWSNLFQPLLNPGSKTVMFNANIKWTFVSMLLGLQLITIGWFFMICRVVVRVVRGQGADDVRSDDEGEGEDEGEEEDDDAVSRTTGKGIKSGSKPQPKYIEVEAPPSDFTISQVKRVGSSGGGGSGPKRKSKGLSTGLSTGLNLGDHKEILNRIGCLSEEQLAREREKKSPDAPRPTSSRR